MVQVKELRQLLSGIPGNFDIRSVSDIRVNYIDGEVYFREDDPETVDEIMNSRTSETGVKFSRFFPNIVGMSDDNREYRTSTIPSPPPGGFDYELSDSNDRFAPGRATMHESEEKFDKEYKEWQAQHPNLPTPKEQFRDGNFYKDKRYIDTLTNAVEKDELKERVDNVLKRKTENMRFLPNVAGD